jgi:hypothetical protein
MIKICRGSQDMKRDSVRQQIDELIDQQVASWLPTGLLKHIRER